MTKNQAKIKSLIITVTDESLPRIEQLANRLGKKGLKVERVLPVTGVITGSCPEAKVPALKKESGVLGIEEENTAYLPPPDSAVQ